MWIGTFDAFNWSWESAVGIDRALVVCHLHRADLSVVLK